MIQTSRAFKGSAAGEGTRARGAILVYCVPERSLVPDPDAPPGFDPYASLELQQMVMSPLAADGLSLDALRAKPFFGPFQDESIVGTNGSAVARARRAYLLATAIPAESYATGANPLPGLKTRDNVDMAAFGCKGKVDSFWTYKKKWTHGYYIDAPLIRAYDLYDRILSVLKGGRLQ